MITICSIDSLNMTDEIMTPLYFGTNGRPGHYFLAAAGEPLGRTLTHGTCPWSPWKGEHIDGKLDQGLGPEGLGSIRHKDGWTWIAWTDYSGDKRPGSNANYILPGVLTFDRAIEAARRAFPPLFARYEYEIRPRA